MDTHSSPQPPSLHPSPLWEGQRMLRGPGGSYLGTAPRPGSAAAATSCCSPRRASPAELRGRRQLHAPAEDPAPGRLLRPGASPAPRPRGFRSCAKLSRAAASRPRRGGSGPACTSCTWDQGTSHPPGMPRGMLGPAGRDAGRGVRVRGGGKPPGLEE